MTFSLKYYLLLAVAIAILVSIASVYALTTGDFSQTDFNSGTYTRTVYNTTTESVHLDSSYNNGTFLSRVFDAGNNAQWSNISWLQGAPYQQELPDNQASETELGGADMTGNILLFHMNEFGGAVIDYSGSNNNASYYNVNNISGGKVNEAYDFNGDSFVNLTLNITGFGSIAIGLWFKVDLIDEDDRLLSLLYATKEEVKIYLTSTEIKGRFDDDSSKEISTNLTNTSVWHNVFIVNNGSDSLLYFDGEFKHSRSETFDFANADGLTYIGSKAGDFPSVRNGFDGKIDEFAMWNRALSDEEILNIYKRGALKLNLSVRSCDDASCSGESFVFLNDISPQTLNLDNDTYFQYRFEFDTDNEIYSPELYNATISYIENNESENTTEIITEAPTGSRCKKRLNLISPSELDLSLKYSELNVTVGNIGSCVLYDIEVSLETPQDWQATSEIIDEIKRNQNKTVSLSIDPLDSAEGDYILTVTAETSGRSETREIVTSISKPEIPAPPIVGQIFEESKVTETEAPILPELVSETPITGYAISDLQEDIFENRNKIYIYLITGLITLLFIIELYRMR